MPRATGFVPKFKVRNSDFPGDEMKISRWIRVCGVFALAAAASLANAQNKKAVPAADVISRSIKAVGYEVGGGSTKVVFLGTSAASQASGEAKIEAKAGGTSIELKGTSMPQA